MGLGSVSVLKLLVFLVLSLQIQLSVAFADGSLYPRRVIWGQRNKNWYADKFNSGIIGVRFSVIQRSFSIFISKYFSAAIKLGQCWEQPCKNVMVIFLCRGDGIMGSEAATHTKLTCLCVTVCHTLLKEKQRSKWNAELSPEKVKPLRFINEMWSYEMSLPVIFTGVLANGERDVHYYIDLHQYHNSSDIDNPFEFLCLT